MVQNPELSPELVLWAYRHGIFPMADDETGEILWFSPDPRAIIDLEHFRVRRTLRSVIRRRRFRVTVDRSFDDVINACADRGPTWISPEIIRVYCELHRLGHAHSLEVWDGERLAGGLYGVALGAAFFGESMFHRRTDASKVGLVALVQLLKQQGFALLDTQYLTSHLAGLGACTLSRDDYLRRLVDAIGVERTFCPPGQADIVVTV